VSGKFTVYNFEVADNHDYFVGKKGVLVHNADYGENLVDKGSFEQARNSALGEIGSIDHSNRKPIVGRLGSGKGKVVGFETQVDGVTKRFRLDYDEKKGIHINVEVGKGANRTKTAYTFPGNKKSFLKLLRKIRK
jgi:hypothetical protein